MVREKKRRKKSVLVTPKINPAWLDPAHAVQRVQHPTRRRSTKNGAKYRPRIASPAPLSPDSLGPIFIIHGVWLGLSAFIIQTYKESCLCVESGISLLFLISIFDEIIGGPTLFQLLSIPRAFYHLCLSLFSSFGNILWSGVGIFGSLLLYIHASEFRVSGRRFSVESRHTARTPGLGVKPTLLWVFRGIGNLVITGLIIDAYIGRHGCR